MKTREEVEAELAKDKEPGGVLAWDRNTKKRLSLREAMAKFPSGVLVNGGPLGTKHTPWVAVHNKDNKYELCVTEKTCGHADCECEPEQEAVCYSEFHPWAEAPVLARRVVASVNSYTKWCEDPVAAAESDLLGRMRDALWLLQWQVALFAKGCPISIERLLECADRAHTLLAETRRGP